MSLRNFFSTAGGELSPAVIIRRIMFLILLLGLGFFYMAIDFHGLTHPKGIEQAQISREIARGNGFTTKMVRPIALDQARNFSRESGKEEKNVMLTKFHDTYHAPLNPMLNSVVLGMFKDRFAWTGEEKIYFLDRVIAVVSVILFLWAIGINYLLISRIFDTKIGGVTALLLLLCDLMWEFSQSGLPQMLMFFLFSFAMYFLYKAIENYQLKRSPVLWLCLAGGFFGLLAMAHWIAIWPFLGLLIFTAFYFKPRGVQAVSMGLVFLVLLSIWGVRNLNTCGNMFGSGYFSVLGGLSNNSESQIMRNFDQNQNPLNAKGMPTRIVLTSLGQLNGLYVYLGSIIAAPLFFLSLLHPFKRPEISNFRWCILLMWVFAVIGMSIFGLSDGARDPNQLHLLFIPLMTAYGLAFLSVLWSRLGITSHLWMVLNGHLIIVVFISALPLLLTFYRDTKQGIYSSEAKTPAFTIRLLQKDEIFKEDEVIATDAPWDVAWYGDRSAVWLPGSLSQFKKLESFADERGTPVKGILLTFESLNQPMISGVIGNGSEFRDYYQLIYYTSMVMYSGDADTNNSGNFLRSKFPLEYKFPTPPVISNRLILFSKEPPVAAP